MAEKNDPFAFHPELRGRITDAETSFFRGFSVDRLVRLHPHLEAFRSWTYADEVREAMRAEALARHKGDLWVFGYGSLMWDPALRFAEVRHAYSGCHARKLILMDDKGGRGTKEAPGLMAALDRGDGCEGLAFRIKEEDIEAETEILFRRELVGPAYLPEFISVRIGEGEVTALAFLANHQCPDILPDISREDQIGWIATGCGFLGTSREYLANIVDHFTHIGIEDRNCTALLHEVDRYLAGQAKGPQV